MSIRFCPKCGSMMVPDKKDGKVVWACRKCSFSESTNSRRVVVKEKLSSGTDVPVVDVEQNQDKLSTIKAKCRKCGHDRAMWWIQQTRSGDEPATRFFKCIKCGYTWREYS